MHRLRRVRSGVHGRKGHSAAAAAQDRAQRAHGGRRVAAHLQFPELLPLRHHPLRHRLPDGQYSTRHRKRASSFTTTPPVSAAANAPRPAPSAPSSSTPTTSSRNATAASTACGRGCSRSAWKPARSRPSNGSRAPNSRPHTAHKSLQQKNILHRPYISPAAKSVKKPLSLSNMAVPIRCARTDLQLFIVCIAKQAIL